MVRRLLPPLLVLAMGCASAPPIPPPARPVEVRIPIYEPAYCASVMPARPALPIAELTATSSPATVIRAYAESVVLLKAAVIGREDLLGACAKPSDAGGGETTAASGQATITQARARAGKASR